MDARWALEAIAHALGIRFGEFTVVVKDGRCTIVKRLQTMPPEELESILLDPPSVG